MRWAAVAGLKLIISPALMFAVFITALAETNQTPGPSALSAPKGVMNPQGESVSELVKQAKDFIGKGDWEKALGAALRADALLQKSPESSSGIRMQSQLTIAKIYLAKKLPEQAEKHVRLGIKFWETTGDKSLDQLLNLYGPLSDSLAAQGKHAEMAELAKAVASIPFGDLAEHDIELVPILLNGHNSAIALGDYDSAIRFISLEVELHQMVINRNPADDEANKLRIELAIRGRLVLGSALSVKGDYVQSVKVLTEAAAEAKRVGFDTLACRILVSLGSAQVGGDQPQEAVSTLANVVERLEPGSAEQTLALTTLGLAYTMIGEPGESEKAFSQLVQISIKAGRVDLALSSLQKQAAALLSGDRPITARECLEYALQALDAHPDKFHEDRFQTLKSLCRVYTLLRDVAKANQALERAWKLLPEAARQQSLVESNLTVGGLYCVESDLREIMHQPDLQLRSALKAHTLALQFAKDDPLLVAVSYVGMSHAFCCSGDFSEALRCLASAEREAGKLAQTNFGLTVRILGQLALVYSDQGDFERAIRVRTQLLELVAQKFGKANARYLVHIEELGSDFFQKGCFEKACELYAEGQLLFSEHEWRDLAFLPLGRSSGISALRILLPHLACLAALSTTNQFAAQNAAYVCALNKGLETEVWAAQAMLSTNQAAASVKGSLDEYWSHRGPGDGNGAASRAYGLRHEASGALLRILEGSKVSFGEIRDSVPSNAVLIDFTQFWRYDSNAKSNPFKEERYAVYLTLHLARGSTKVVVERLDLGEVAPINEAVEVVCKRMSAGQYAAKDLSSALQRLSDLVYAPLAKHLTNVSHLIICPDGQLSRLPFEMLSYNGRFLIEEKTISYVGSGREIVRLQSRSGVSPDSNLPGTATYAAGQAGRPSYVGPALVMGGPDFDLDLSKAGSASFRLAGSAGIPAQSSELAAGRRQNSQAGTPALRSLSRDYRGIKFPPLPGAEAEARSVAKLLGGDCVLRVGPEAREAELKAAVSPRVLHLATHGFFLSDQEFRRTNALPFEWPGEWGQAGRLPYVQNDWENPLVRCGIALAGANSKSEIRNPKSEIEDGLLTGLEASLLNLQGTELVILSACDSGTGEVKIGEGVMSLRRAFRIAGAQTVLASHWKVSDKATSRLMTEFIGRWRSGEPRAKAWREAQLSLLRSKEYSNPYFWAAFTLTGQWR
jgi:CHAT domain-containing protein/tetratricopeptide (TPR) repeat protein